MVSFALKEINVCLTKCKSNSLMSAYNRYTRSLGILNLQKSAQIGLFYLMRMWHEGVFRHYACIKMVFDKCQPYFIDERTPKLLIRRYEESTPLWFFKRACFLFGITFQAHIQHYTRDTEYIMFRGEYPNFVKERMGWTDDVITFNYNSWPLEFLFKFPLGMYRNYDYIKVLNVGLEPKTYISLHSDKLKKLLSQLVKKQALRNEMPNIREMHET